MKFFHLSDLHLGKRVNEFSMLEEQIYILDTILRMAEEEQPDGVLIAGDIYDKTVPTAEAVQVFDDFLCRLSATGTRVFLISGNHDSAERIAFGGRLMNTRGVYVSPVYNGDVAPITLRDEHGEVDVFLLPFLKPANVRRWYPDEDTSSYTAALRTAIAHMPIRPDVRSVLVTHQFVTGATTCESEVSVGGSDNVDAAVFAPFDYVALGHIHGPQRAADNARYCGSPLKYSFSEVAHQKSVTVAELPAKGALTLRTLPLTPLHDMAKLRGTYDELMDRRRYQQYNTADYLHITLTDEEDVPDAIGRLRAVYPRIMKLDYDNQRTRAANELTPMEQPEQRSPLAVLEELYEKQNGQPLSEEQRTFAEGLIEEIWGGCA